jgi:hypothetical protein
MKSVARFIGLSAFVGSVVLLGGAGAGRGSAHRAEGRLRGRRRGGVEHGTGREHAASAGFFDPANPAGCRARRNAAPRRRQRGAAAGRQPIPRAGAARRRRADRMPRRAGRGGRGGGGASPLDFANSDLAFRGNELFIGNFSGFNTYDISNPRDPKLLASIVCPGGQGDVSVHGNLLFMSVEQTRGRLDCGTAACRAR